jgi:hypothetical protein
MVGTERDIVVIYGTRINGEDPFPPLSLSLYSLCVEGRLCIDKVIGQ